jgi:RNA polymerase sigma-70 factor (ECF subfamily)
VSPEDKNVAQWFATDVQVHEGALRAWLRAKFPLLSDPDDIVQESLVRVWSTRSEGAVVAPKALLFSTARNLAIDELRRRKIATIEGVAEIDELFVSTPSRGVAESVAHDQELGLLTQALQSLPPRCRQVLTLRKIYGLSQKEIAAQLGIAVHTVEAQIGNGMRGCAAFLARHGLP